MIRRTGTIITIPSKTALFKNTYLPKVAVSLTGVTLFWSALPPALLLFGFWVAFGSWVAFGVVSVVAFGVASGVAFGAASWRWTNNLLDLTLLLER